MGKKIHDDNNGGGHCPPSCINPDFSIEKNLLDQGSRLIAGVDEAGRGALAGPLAVGLVMYPSSVLLDPDHDILGHVRDSKQLSPKRRSHARGIIRTWSLFSDVLMVSHRTVDALNVNRATEFALNRIIERMDPKPDIVLIDGNFSFNLPVPAISVVKGDTRSISIASASIMAKVRRDEVMDRLDLRYPGYGFSKHKGYGTAMHRQAIMDRGYSAVHRRSYEPVRSMIAHRAGESDED